MIVVVGDLKMDLTDDQVAHLRRQLIPDEEIEAEVEARDEQADQEAEAFEDPNEVLTLKEIVDRRIVPLSYTTLARIAQEGAEDSPFYKRGGRWMATRGDLRAWVRSAPRGSGDPIDPMPPTCASAADVMAAIKARSGQ